jgi:hypothetical protein
MARVLFVACSSFSGSTLLSFLLNTHPDIVTAGHTIGWRYKDGDVFYCSCGRVLESCPFFQTMAKAFQDNGLPFDFRDFGTRYEIARSPRLNRYLTMELPLVRSNRVEGLRDALVRLNRVWARALDRQNRANLIFVQTALSYSGAHVFVENTHNPYRLRHLGRIPELDLAVVYLVRDIRGVVYSYMKNHGWDLDFAIRTWFRQQSNIVRILKEFDHTVTISYERLCDSTDEVLASLHRFVGVQPRPFAGDFKSAEHHILGNVMRLTDSKISKDIRWQEKLSANDLEAIRCAGLAFAKRNRGHPVSEIVGRYLEPL